MPKIAIDSKVESLILEKLKNQSAKKVAEAVQILSDFYVDNPEGQTPWNDERTLLAYWGYYHPLNYLRNKAVIQRCQPVGFFNGVTNALDYGCGLGAGSNALSELLGLESAVFDQSHIPVQSAGLSHLQASMLQVENAQSDLLLASYALTELEELPHWLFRYKKVLLIEPSTHQDNQRLLRWRKQLIDKGFHIAAPCTHQSECPMTNSKRDWCHDRCHPEFPVWLKEIDDHLPMRNQTLTMSYLAAQKDPIESAVHRARMVGDPLQEKGKTRQMICFDSKRHFVSWLHRKGKPSPPQRGELVRWSETHTSNEEIRIQGELDPI